MKQSTMNTLAGVISALIITVLLIGRGAPFVTIFLSCVVIYLLVLFANMTGNLGVGGDE